MLETPGWSLGIGCPPEDGDAEVHFFLRRPPSPLTCLVQPPFSPPILSLFLQYYFSYRILSFHCHPFVLILDPVRPRSVMPEGKDRLGVRRHRQGPDFLFLSIRTAFRLSVTDLLPLGVWEWREFEIMREAGGGEVDGR